MKRKQATLPFASVKKEKIQERNEVQVVDLTCERKNPLEDLMKRAKEPQRHEYFFLNFHSSTWSWNWTTAKVESEDDQWRSSFELAHDEFSKPVVIHLSTNMRSLEEAVVSNRQTSFSPSVLKSGLQKAFRRGNTDSCLAALAELWRIDPMQVLRRLPIVIIEDGMCHPATPVLIWLMLATQKGFICSSKHFDLVASITRDATTCRWRDVCFSLKEEEKLSTVSKLSSINETTKKQPLSVVKLQYLDALFATQPAEAIIIRSLLLRAMYGGMKGDVEMLQSMAWVYLRRSLSKNSHIHDDFDAYISASNETTRNCWLQILNTVHEIDKSSQTCYQVKDLPIDFTFHKNSLVLASIDSHCTSILDAVLASEKGQEVVRVLSQTGSPVEDTISTMIWELRSSINARLDVSSTHTTRKKVFPPTLMEAWTMLEPELDKWSRHYMSSHLLV
jgi:hypothetical protein